MEAQNKYVLYQEIGTGAFGKVYLAEDRINKRKVAIKRMPKNKIISNPYLLQAFWKEIEIMKKCKCKNSVEFIELLESQNNYNVVMELCDADLQIYLMKKNHGFPKEEIRKIFLQLNNVFKIMYSQNIMHRDLKLKNIMIKFTNDEKTEYEVKLSDYGFSKALDENLITTTHLGTPATMAPEVLSNNNYSLKADLWSIGVLLYQLFFNELPYLAVNEKKLLEKILANYPIKKCDDDILNDLITKLLIVDPEKRISWNEYFMHPFFNPVLNNNSLKNQKFEKIKEFNFGLDIPNLKIYIGKENSSNMLIFIKQFSNSFANQYKQQIQKEIDICNLFELNKNVIQFYKIEKDNNYTYLLFKYIEGESLFEYSQKNNVNEEKIKKMNLEFYENIGLFININQIQFNIISLYNFIVNKNEELILFDFGLISYLIPYDIKKEYFITSPNEINKITGKSNILNYGITIFKTYYKDTITIKDKIINIPDTKPISKEFMSFISKCIYRNIEKRHSWNSFPLDSFLYSPSNNIEPLINKYKLNIILKGLEFRFQFIVDYYNSIDFNEEKSRKFLKEIGLFLTISFIELQTIRKIFDKFIKKDNNFSLEEEISFIQIYNNSFYDFVTYNLGSSPKEKKIFSEEENELMIPFMEKTKILLSGIIKNIIRIKKIDKNICSLGENSMIFIKQLLDGFNQSKIQNYFYNLTQEGIQYFETKNFDISNKKLTIAEFLCEYIIFMKAFITNNNKNINNFNLIDKFFTSNDQICISTVFLQKDNTKYLFVSFLGGMFRYYNNKLNNVEIESENYIKNCKEVFDGLIQFYPSLMKMVIDSSKS